MKTLGSLLQSGDWKGEKHVPVIHLSDTAKAGELVEIGVSIGDEIAHPNNFDHYIAWIKILYMEDGGKFPVELGDFQFKAHGEGDNFTEPFASVKVKLSKSGTVYAVSYCNIHGLWENSHKINIE